MPSPTALAYLKANLKAVSALLRLERTYPDPPKPEYVALVTGLRGGAAVLVVAAFEDFLSRLTEEALGRISAEAVDFSRLPQEIRTQSVFATLNRAMAGDGPRPDRLPHITLACQKVLSDRVNPQVFGLAWGNPDPKVVRELFKNIGITDIFACSRTDFDRRWGQQSSTTFIADKLNEIVDRRHTVAHTANVLNVTRVDLYESVRFIGVLASTLRAVTHAQVTGIRQSASRR